MFIITSHSCICIDGRSGVARDRGTPKRMFPALGDTWLRISFPAYIPFARPPEPAEARLRHTWVIRLSKVLTTDDRQRGSGRADPYSFLQLF